MRVNLEKNGSDGGNVGEVVFRILPWHAVTATNLKLHQMMGF